jgi:hypothetical protein
MILNLFLPQKKKQRPPCGCHRRNASSGHNSRGVNEGDKQVAKLLTEVSVYLKKGGWRLPFFPIFAAVWTQVSRLILASLTQQTVPCSLLINTFALRCLLSEPTEDWTVEDVMQWCLLRSHEATDAKHDEMINALNQQLDEGTKELWKCHELALASGEKPPENDKDTDEQQINQREPGSDVKYIHVEVTDGPYVGKTYKLQPRKRAACWVGRSAGKKFVEKGISLSKDDEVSTTHGKFELTNGKAFFTDTGSTNGTVHAGQELEDNIPLELQDGMFLKMGCTTVKITLLYT